MLMRTIGQLFTWLASATFVLLSAIGASAQQEGADAIRRELADLRAEIRQLWAELDALRDSRRGIGPLLRLPVPRGTAARRGDAATDRGGAGAGRAGSQASLELLQAQVAELSW